MAAMNPSGLRRNLMNIVHNYTDAQVKVREATSNDPWGPSSTLMSEIADLTYNMVAFSEIMMMIWKRLNDHGKNWRHVYKALILLEYMIKTGSEKVAQQCKENIFAIQTLKDFQYLEENRDQGVNVREKAKQLVTLLKDDERLKNERARALKAKERLAQSATGIGHEIPAVDGGVSYRYPDSYNEDGMTTMRSDRERRISSELECARPQTAGEEELQLQLALAMSKEEADQEDQKRRSDDVRLQMAITQSEEDFSVSSPGSIGKMTTNKKFQDCPVPQKQSNLLDLLDVAIPGSSNTSRNTDPWGMPTNDNNLAASRPQLQNKSYDDLLGLNLYPAHPVPRYYDDTNMMLMKASDPWAPNVAMTRSSTTSPIATDPWTGRPASSLGVPTPAAFDRPQTDPWSTGTASPNTDPWGTPLNASFGSSPSLATNGDLQSFDPLRNNNTTTKKTPEVFLGANSALVNLDSLIGSKPSSQMSGSTNPFATSAPTSVPPRISLNDMQASHQSIGLNYSGRPQQLHQIPTIQAAYPINTVNQFNGNSQQVTTLQHHGMIGMQQQPMANNPFR